MPGIAWARSSARREPRSWPGVVGRLRRQRLAPAHDAQVGGRAAEGPLGPAEEDRLAAGDERGDAGEGGVGERLRARRSRSRRPGGPRRRPRCRRGRRAPRGPRPSTRCRGRRRAEVLAGAVSSTEANAWPFDVQATTLRPPDAAGGEDREVGGGRRAAPAPRTRSRRRHGGAAKMPSLRHSASTAPPSWATARAASLTLGCRCSAISLHAARLRPRVRAPRPVLAGDHVPRDGEPVAPVVADVHAPRSRAGPVASVRRVEPIRSLEDVGGAAPAVVGDDEAPVAARHRRRRGTPRRRSRPCARATRGAARAAAGAARQSEEGQREGAHERATCGSRQGRAIILARPWKSPTASSTPTRRELLAALPRRDRRRARRGAVRDRGARARQRLDRRLGRGGARAPARRRGHRARPSAAARRPTTRPCWQRARGRYGLMLNEDSELRPGATAALHAALEAHPRAAAAGARLLRPDGAPQAVGLALPGGRRALRSARSAWHGATCRSTATRSARSTGRTRPRCSCAARRARRSAGSIPAFFVYSDEVDFCRRLRDAGWSILYVPRRRGRPPRAAVDRRGRRAAHRRVQPQPRPLHAQAPRRRPRRARCAG